MDWFIHLWREASDVPVSVCGLRAIFWARLLGARLSASVEVQGGQRSRRNVIMYLIAPRTRQAFSRYIYGCTARLYTLSSGSLLIYREISYKIRTRMWYCNPPAISSQQSVILHIYILHSRYWKSGWCVAEGRCCNCRINLTNVT